MSKILQIAICLLAMGTGSLGLFAQGQSRKNLRQEEKRVQAISDSLSYVQAREALEDGRFVIEVDRLLFKRGRTASVSTNTNFVSQCGSEAMVQITFSGVHRGPSGIGGITLQGTASDISIESTRNGTVNYKLRVLDGGIAAEIRIILTAGSNQARVEIDPDFHSEDLIMYGRIIPYDDSSVYRGRVY